MKKAIQTQLLVLMVAVCAMALSGCGKPNLMGVNAYESAVHPNPQQTYVMDPGSFGGIASASGGTQTGTSYGTGAKGTRDGDPAHFQKLENLRPKGQINWSDPNPQDNHPLPNGI